MAASLGPYLWGDHRASPLRTAHAFAHGQQVVVGVGFRIRGIRNVRVDNGRLLLGVTPFGFIGPREGGLLRVLGQLTVTGPAGIAAGGRWDIGSGASAHIAPDTYFGPGTKVVISHRLDVGHGCAISWDCQILDDDFHRLSDTGRRGGPISIGDRVWVGSRAMILKDTTIGDGCVVAAGAVVRGDFSEPGCLIGGVPARVIRKEISWA